MLGSLAKNKHAKSIIARASSSRGLLSTHFILFICLSFICSSVIGPTVEALSQAQKDTILSGARYFNTEEDGVIECAPGSTSTNTPKGDTYFVGDSLTVGMEAAGLQQKVETTGSGVSKIQATQGDSVSAALNKVRGDSAAIGASSTAVVALGTNDGANLSAESFNSRISQMISAIKSANSTIQIYWVNAYKDGDPSAYSGVNTAINNQSSTLGYRVINWNAEAKSNNSKYAPFDASLKVHPTNYGAMADFVVGSLSAGSVAAGSCACTASSAGGGAVGPALPGAVPEPYFTLLTNAAKAFGINAQFLATIYLTENGNIWKPFNTQWATSPAGAQGPFQFMPATWEAYKTDGNGDGVIEINNIYDAAYSAAKMLKGYSGVNTPLGSLDTPFHSPSLITAAIAYNWGPGNVSRTDREAPLSAASTEAQYYARNVYALITSGFTKGDRPGYPNPVPQISGGGAGGTVGAPTAPVGCSGGVVAGSIVKTALGLAWPSGDHGKEKEDATPAYQTAMPQYNGSAGDDEWSDCGVFTATVMISSGADRNYAKRGTGVQIGYVEQNLDKYTIIRNVGDTSDLQPGDILIYNGADGGHTFVYVGQQPDFSGNKADASWHDHVPQAGDKSASFYSPRAGNYIIARMK